MAKPCKRNFASGGSGVAPAIRRARRSATVTPCFLAADVATPNVKEAPTIRVRFRAS